MSSANYPDIVIGGLVGWRDLASPENTDDLRATGRVGLYVQESLLDPRSNEQWGDPASNAAVDSVFGLAPGQLGNDDYEGDFYLPEAPGYWDPNATELDLNYPMAALPAENLPLPNCTTVNFGGTYNSAADYYAFFNSPATQRAWTEYVNGGRQKGVDVVQPIFAPNGFFNPDATSQWDMNFNDPIYDGLKKMALAGGGICVDSPPGYVDGVAAVVPNVASDYMNFIEQEINWANSQGLLSSVILCPYLDDATFAVDAENFVAELEAAGAAPGQFIVENYDVAVGSTLGIGSDTDPNSLAGVALWLARNAATYQPIWAATGAAPSATDQDPTTTSDHAGEVAPAAGAASGGATFDISSTGGDEASGGADFDENISVAGGAHLLFGAATATATCSIHTGSGDDTIISGLGDTTIWAGTGRQAVFGSGDAGSSTSVLGNSGSLQFVGGAGTESVTLANGKATVFGGLGHDSITAGSGSAVVVTGSAATEILLQTGSAAIFEMGGGAVRYGFLADTPFNQAIDFISGFTAGKDTLQVSSFGAGTAATLIANQQHFGGSTQLTLPDGTRLVLASIGSVDARFFS